MKTEHFYVQAELYSLVFQFLVAKVVHLYLAFVYYKEKYQTVLTLAQVLRLQINGKGITETFLQRSIENH